MKLPWCTYEDDVLGYHWGRKVPSAIAKECNRLFGRRRTTRAVTDRARRIGLPPHSAVIKSVWGFARETGYSRSRIETALRRLSIVPKRTGAGKRALTLVDQRRLIEFLATVPDGTKLMRAVSGAWGKEKHGGGRKPAACIDCGRDTVPYFCRGRCRRCDRRWRAGREPVSFGSGT